MSDPGYDETDMTPEEFDARLDKAVPANISPTPPQTFFLGEYQAARIQTGASLDETREEDVQLAGRTIREYRAFADT